MKDNETLSRRPGSKMDRRGFLGTTSAAALTTAAGALSKNAAGQYVPQPLQNQNPALPKDIRYNSRLRVGLFTWMFNDKPLGWVLEYAQQLKLGMLEIGSGNDPGAKHCPVDQLLNDSGSRGGYLKQFSDHGLAISAFSCHGNPLHPDARIARSNHDTFVKSLRLAQLMDVPVVVCFSGCPGDDRGSGRPNWVASIDNDEYINLLKWQWDQKIIPYWKEASGIARQYGRRVALEFDPGYSVYNVSSLLRLRSAAGDNIGCNLDLSNMFAQGIDSVAVIKALGEAGALYHFHAKDAVLDQANADVNGYLDLTPYEQVLKRSWSYAIPGYGHDTGYWKKTLSALKNVGYDYVLSIEHEDPTTQPVIGVRKAAEFLHSIALD